MVLKLFSKGPTHEAEAESEVESTPVSKLEGTVTDLGAEVKRLRQDVNTLLARQDSFRMALRRLREYLEEKGASDEEAQEVGAQFQDLPHEEPEHHSQTKHASLKNKSHLH